MTVDFDPTVPADLTGSSIRLEQAALVKQATALLVQAGMDSAAEMLPRLASEKEQPPEAFQERTFFRDTYLVTVIRDEPDALENLSDIAHAISEGGFTGQHHLLASEPLDFEQARRAVEAVGSEPAFFYQLAEEDDEEDAGGEVAAVTTERGG